MVFVPIFLLCLMITAPATPSSAALPKSDTSLNERMDMLEQLLLQQNLVISQLKMENSALKSELQKQQQRWDIEREVHLTLLKELRQLLKEDQSKDFSRSADHAVASRADDVNSLEPMVTQMAQRITEMNAEVQALQDAATAAASSVYVRWGNSQCPGSNNLVYSGVIGGSYYSATGAATNHLCLTLSPHLSDHPLHNNYAKLYGSEFYTYTDSHQLKDPVCAVCRSPRPTIIMIPGTDICETGWTTEYTGFLMAGLPGNNAGTEYICVDSKLESKMSSDTQQLGDHLTYTVTHCGTLPCEPYVNNKVVTCAVCSK